MSSRFSYFEENNIQLNGVIHVGAHRGEEINEYGDLGAKTVIWVEANPEVFDEMCIMLTNAEANIDSHAFQYAASTEDHGTAEFNRYYGPDAGHLVGNKGCSSLLKAEGRFEEWYKDTIEVETITIDTLLEEEGFNVEDFQLLNMDVQGAELMVLRGSEKVLDNVKWITTEATWEDPDYIDNVMYDELKSFLESKGFVETQIIPHAENWGDVLFVKETHE
jgi:FkbM family methyltransferase|tara:strand:- start:115 stop:774 length:660 start_codon:yes stop_codon:yes gene_type:complete